jgi:two-component system cell cycle response regulator DivK
MKLLIVEDNADIRYLLSQIFETEGYTLLYAENGQRGLEIARAELPNVILMDMSLPVLTGWEAVYQLRQEVAFQHTPIIAMTAHASQSDQDRAIQSGCTAYISKPFDMEHILEMVASFQSPPPQNSSK